MNTFSNLVAAAALALVPATFASSAHADTIRVRVDNYLNPSQYEHAKSGDPITAYIRFYGSSTSYETSVTKTLNTISGQHDFVWNVPGKSAYDVDRIGLNMFWGEDLLIVDQVELFTGGGTRVAYWGVDNEYGYCISWQSSDGSNSHCHDATATTFRAFYR